MYDESRGPGLAPEFGCLFIVIGYQRSDLVLGFLRSLLGQERSTWRCVVVDNDASNGDIRAVAESVADARVAYVAANQNLGYFPGADLGLRTWRAAGRAMPDWVVICNQDLVLQTDFVSRLGDFEPEVQDRVWCLAPRVLDSTTNGDSNPYMVTRPSITKQLAVALLSLSSRSYSILAARYDRNEVQRAEQRIQEGEREIYAAHGSLICVSSAFFDAGGTINRRRRLFGEEVFLAEQLARSGARTLYLPSLRATHEAHATTEHSDIRDAKAIMAERRAASWGIVGELLRARLRRTGN